MLLLLLRPYSALSRALSLSAAVAAISAERTIIIIMNFKQSAEAAATSSFSNSFNLKLTLKLKTSLN